LRTQKVQLGDFGTFSADLTLPGDAPLGQYRIMLTNDGGRRTEDGGRTPGAAGPPSSVRRRPSSQPLTAQGSFQVAVYRLEKVRLALELPKSVYLRGEPIKGKIR